MTQPYSTRGGRLYLTFENKRLHKNQILLRKVVYTKDREENTVQDYQKVFFKKVSDDTEKFIKLKMGKF